MKMINVLFCLAVPLFLIGIDQAWSYPVADTIRYPLDSYVVGSNHFGVYGLVRENKWHLGDDVGATAGTDVFSLGNGIVRRSQVQNGYGGMYIIEHNVNGEKVCALYVHMNFDTFQKSVGDEVTKGEYLGQIGNFDQNGGWPVHFHFGIRKGSYPVDPNEYVYGDWIFSGYTAEESVLDDWHIPSDFLKDHAQVFSTTIDYPQFTVEDLAQFNLVGNAVHDDNVDALVLTPGGGLETGAAWFVERLYIKDGFETEFSFWISRDGADGLALVLQDYSGTALGGAGGGLGYHGLPRNLAVEIDLHLNTAGDFGDTESDPNDNHISIHTLGLNPNDVAQYAIYPDSVSGQATDIPFLSDGQLHVMKVRYFDHILTVYVDDMVIPYLEISIDISNLLGLDDGKAWIGFTGATGGLTQAQYIFSWFFTTEGLLSQPDLTTSIEVNPTMPRVDEVVTVGGMVTNSFEIDTEPCQVKISLGTKSSIVDLPAILAGGSHHVSANFVSEIAGDQIAQIFVDSSNIITEEDESNNVAETIVTVLPPLRPDLVITLLNAYKQKGAIVIDAEVANIGTAAAGYFELDLDIVETGDLQVASFSSLGVNASEVVQFSFKKLSAKKPPRGAINFIATIDSTGLVVELDEANNQLQTSITARK